ncbi:hypothetical protein SAMN04489761_3119 [Tenacibaculum sp. MAR_2009_124]|nr:hypothetical protein [Tenacibaculum sp. MAR_2009_124]SEC48356.1 hypothetical protein SAMN04489761_3119 [Tenacibaculum sp. MAR_2009_124]
MKNGYTFKLEAIKLGGGNDVPTQGGDTTGGGGDGSDGGDDG